MFVGKKKKKLDDIWKVEGLHPVGAVYQILPKLRHLGLNSWFNMLILGTSQH